MTKFEKEDLGKKAKALGFSRDPYEKVCRLVKILGILEGDQLLGNTLALKGGTAINLLIFNDLPRLSVDIDLDYVVNVSREELDGSKLAISDLIGKYMHNDGYVESNKSRNSHSLISSAYIYNNSAGANDNIRIEINYLLRAHILPTEKRNSCSDHVLGDFSIRSLSEHEIFASKIVALLNRGAARDLYDTYRMVVSGIFDKSQIPFLRKCVVFYDAISGGLITDKNPMRWKGQINSRKIKTDLTPMLRRTDDFEFRHAVADVESYLSELLNLGYEERSFIESFRRKDYRPELLFDNPEVIDRIKYHPMAIWRTSKERTL